MSKNIGPALPLLLYTGSKAPMRHFKIVSHGRFFLPLFRRGGLSPYFSFQARSLTNSSSSSFSGVVSLVIWTNSMSIILAQSRICPADTS